MNKTLQRILVVGPAWVGDMVMAQSLFITLKQQYPDALIDVVAPEWSVPLLERMPEVNTAIVLPVQHKQLALMTRYRLGRSLRDKHYDCAIVLPRSYKAALVPFFAGAAKRVGYRGEMRYGVINDIRPLDKSVLTRTVQRYVALGLEKNSQLPPATPYPRLAVDKDNARHLAEKLELTLDRPVVGFMPGAEYGPAKQWPIAYYAQLAQKLVEQGGQVWVFGSQKEQALGDEIASNNPHVHNLCGKTALIDVVDMISLCDKVVSNDSGLMHVACATGKQVIGIYGSSTPDYTPPLSDNAKVVYLGLECSPCFKRQCPLGHTNCLNNISADDILDNIKQ